MWRGWSCRTGIAQELVDACGLMGLVGAFLQTRGVASGLGVQARRGAEITVALVEVGGDGAATRDVQNVGCQRTQKWCIDVGRPAHWCTMAAWTRPGDDGRCTNDRSAASQRRTVTMVRSQGSLTSVRLTR